MFPKPWMNREIRSLLKSASEVFKSGDPDLKTKELVIDDRKQGGGHAPVCINGAEVGMVMFLGVMIANNLSWSTHVDTTLEKAQQLLYFVRRLRNFSVSVKTLS
eukprot:g24806.t1